MSENQDYQITVTGRLLGGGVFSPKGDKDEYSACVVLDEGEEKKIETLRAQATTDKWGSKIPGGLMDWTVRYGDDEEFENSFERHYINPKSKDAVNVMVRRDGELVPVKKSDGVVYPGCYVAVSVSVYAYDGNREKKMKPGVTLSLRGILFLKDGEALGRSFNADEEFEGFESLVPDIDDEDIPF